MRSMTGFAKVEKKYKEMLLQCQLKSLNHRFLQTRLNLHPEAEEHDHEIIRLIKQRVTRGFITATVNIYKSDSKPLIFSSQRLNEVKSEITLLKKKLGPDIQITLSDFIDLNEKVHFKPLIPQKQISTLMNECLNKLLDFRKKEGKLINQIFQKKITSMKKYASQIKRLYPAILEQNRKKITDLLSSASESVYPIIRSELIQLVDKSMVSEEIERIQFHLDKLTDTISRPGPVGKELSFLLQELTRETNTLSAKAATSKIQYTCVKIKELIEELREQAENVE